MRAVVLLQGSDDIIEEPALNVRDLCGSLLSAGDIAGVEILLQPGRLEVRERLLDVR